MIVTDTIQNLIQVNKPQQIEFLEFIVETLKKSQTVSHLLVRGSIAKGRVDRSSDVDLVIGIQPDQIQDFLAVIDIIIDVELGGLFPGWFDTLAPKLGGWGFVYLVPFKNVLYELDLYIVPEPTIPSIIASGALEIHSNKNNIQSEEPDLKQNFEVNDIIKNDPALDLVIEVLCLLHMLSKRTARQQWYIVYGLSYLINDAMRRFIKFCLIPDSPHWGWYHLEDELGVDPRGRKCLQALSTLINVNAISDTGVIWIYQFN